LKGTNLKIGSLYFKGVQSEFWEDVENRPMDEDQMISVDEAAKTVWLAAQQPDSMLYTEPILPSLSHV